VRERIRKLDEFVPLVDYFFSGDLDYAALGAELVPKKRDAASTATVLDALVEELDGLRLFSAEALEAKLRAFCERVGWPSKDVFMAVRVAVTGRKASPPLFETMTLCGRGGCRRRFGLAVEYLKRAARSGQGGGGSGGKPGQGGAGAKPAAESKPA